MKEEIKNSKYDSVKMPKLKGITEVIIKDAETGEIISQTRDENMVTYAVRDILNSNYNGQLDYGPVLPLATNLFGGVLCFRNALEENAEKYWVPVSTSNEIIAHAGQTTYESAAADTKRGLPNSNLTKSGTNQYTLAWDFPVTQGNGNISAIALTSKQFGDFAFYGKTAYTPYINSPLINFGGDNLTNPIIYDEPNKVSYCISVGGNVVTVKQTPNSSIHKRIGLGTRRFFGNTEESTTWEATFSRSMTGCSIHYNDTTNEVHFLLASGSTIYREILNLGTKAVTTSNMTVPGASLSNWNGNRGINFDIHLTDNGYMYWPGTNAKTLYRIKYTNPSDVVECINVDGVDIGRDTGVDHMSFGNVVYVTNIIAEGNKFYQTVQRTIDYTTYCNSPFIVGENTPVRPLSAKYVYDSNRKFSTDIFTPYLATINNLETPVQKTPSQTMHITYTLIELNEEA